MRRLTKNPWVVCLAAASFFFYQYIQMASFNSLKTELMLEFNASSSALSILSSLYFYGTVLFLIPAGILLDKLSTRTIILMAMSLSLVGLFIFINAQSLYMAGLGRFIIGVSGGPFCFLSNMRLASRWFPENLLAFVTGIIVSIAMVGGVISQTPFMYLVSALGWKSAMFLNLAVGSVILGIIYLFVQDYPDGKKQEYLQQIKFYREIGFVNGLTKVILQAQNWYCGIFASLLNLPIFVFGTLWGVTYLNQIHKLNYLDASMVCSMLFIGMLIGAPVFGFLSDKLYLRKVPMLAGALLCFLCMLFIIESSSLPLSTLIVAFFLVGFGSSAQILAYPTVAESNPLALTGSALGLASTLIMSAGAIFLPIIGFLVELNWDSSTIDGVAVYSYSNYNLALWIVPASIFVAGFFVVLIRETYCKRIAK